MAGLLRVPPPCLSATASPMSPLPRFSLSLLLTCRSPPPLPPPPSSPPLAVALAAALMQAESWRWCSSLATVSATLMLLCQSVCTQGKLAFVLKTVSPATLQPPPPPRCTPKAAAAAVAAVTLVFLLVFRRARLRARPVSSFGLVSDTRSARAKSC
jgi:hypothetical protein